MEISQVRGIMLKVKENIERVIIGKGEVIELVLTGLLAGGNILLEDVPGTGKTMLSKALAKSVQGEFHRIQFTADLLPSDVTGIHFFHQKSNYCFIKGSKYKPIIIPSAYYMRNRIPIV